MVAFAADAGILHADILDFRIAAADFQREGMYSIVAFHVQRSFLSLAQLVQHLQMVCSFCP